VERRHDHPVTATAVVQQIDHPLRHRLVGVEVDRRGRVLDLDVHQQAPALVEHLGQGRQPREPLADRRQRMLGEHAEPFDVHVVVNDQRAVGGPVHVELDAVGALLPGEDERLDGVLPGAAWRAPVTEDQGGGRGHAGSVFAWALQKRWSWPLQRVLARP
jgi:hypothetical protein